MGPLVLLLPEDLAAFLTAQVEQTRCGSEAEFLIGLLRAARERAIADRLKDLLLAVMERDGTSPTTGDTSSLPSSSAVSPNTSTIDMHRMALDDVAAEVDRYTARGLAAIAERFRHATQRSIAAVAEHTLPGETVSALGSAFPGPVASWPVRGFSDHRIYAVNEVGRWRVLRVLHRVRDIEAGATRPVSVKPDE